MRAFAEFIASHRRGALLAAVALLAFAALSAARCSALAEQRAEEGRQPLQEGAPVRDAEEEGGSPLSEGQKGLVSGYGREEDELARCLESYVWESADGSSTLSFSENAFSVSQGGKGSEPRAFAISALAGPGVGTGGEADDASPTIAALLMGDGSTAIVSIERMGLGSDPGLAMTSDAFSGSKTTYVARRAPGAAAVEGMGDDVAAVLGIDAAGLEEAVRAKVESAYPTASTATWEGGLLLDYGEGTAQTSFELDDAKGSKLVATWHMGEGDFELREARR